MIATDDAVVDLLRPLVTHEVDSWTGLPPLSGERVEEALGPATEREDLKLGWYPATRVRYGSGRLGAPVDVYVRHGQVALVEVEGGPPAAVLETLGTPSAVMAHEIVRPGAYVHEYVYGPRGLVLSVAQPFEAGAEWVVVRTRGIAPMASDQRLGPELHRSVEDTQVWQ